MHPRVAWAAVRAQAAVVLDRLKDFDPSQPRDEDGRWTDGGGSSDGSSGGDWAGTSRPDNTAQSAAEDAKYQKEKLITDGPNEGFSRVGVAKGENAGYWGDSHHQSFITTGHAAEVMGIDGYEQHEAPKLVKTLVGRFLDTIANGRLSEETLFHGFIDQKNIEWKVGDTVRLPLLASTGDESTAFGYATNYSEGDAAGKGATAFEFAAGTPMAGYLRWDREHAKEFGHQWMEAIVAGEFKVTGIRTGKEGGWRELPVKVVQLAPVRVFDPASRKWREGL
jgi:hypothetical protein